MANFRFPAPVARASGAFLLAIASSLAGAPTHAQTTDLPQTPDKITLASFSAPQIEAQLANELLALARPLMGKEDELSLRSAHVLAVGLAHLGRTEEALRIALSADEFYSHDAGAQDEIWAATARRKLAFGKSAEAKLAAARIKEPKMRGGVLAAFAFEALARNNKSEALAFLSQSVGTDGVAAGRDFRLAVLFARAGEIATARRIFGRAETALKRSEDVMADEFADFNGLDWENIIAAQIEAGLGGDVAALVARIGKHRSDALDQLLSAGEFESSNALIAAGKEPAERALLRIDLA